MDAASPADERTQGRVSSVRRFNRLYTRQIGLLQESLHRSGFSLTEVRVLYEIAHHEQLTATDLTRRLALDAGYTSRILRRFEVRGLIRKTASPTDARQSFLALTAKGLKTFAPLETAADQDVSVLLTGLSERGRHSLVQAMNAIERVLEPTPADGEPFIIRAPAAGDMGWVIHRHGAVYSQEYGWTQDFEALVAEIVLKFMRTQDRARERCWIAEAAGEKIGCVFLMQESTEVARLRLLLVEPGGRGLGVGRRLVDECIDFAKTCGYRKMTLWTNDLLHSARRIYEAAGFVLVKETRHHSFGHDLTGQDWDLNLTP